MEERKKRYGYEGKTFNRYPVGPSREELLLAMKTELPKSVFRSNIENIFEEQGWSVLFTPPYCPDLQPIEKVWSQCKGVVGREWKQQRSLKQTFNHLMVGLYGGKIGDNVYSGVTAENCKNYVQFSISRTNSRVKRLGATGTVTDGIVWGENAYFGNEDYFPLIDDALQSEERVMKKTVGE